MGRQALWFEPWLLDAILDAAGNGSQHLPELLEAHRHRWQGYPSYLYADSGSGAGKYLNRIEQAGFTLWSVSLRIWEKSQINDWRLIVSGGRG